MHSNAAGANAVVAVFLHRGGSSGALSPIFNQLPNDVNVHHELEAPFNPARFLPDARYHVRYLGSLTTPPCTERVRWFVLDTPVKVSDEPWGGCKGISMETAAGPAVALRLPEHGSGLSVA
ncbi:MAG TPA: carbonic anhydrase family protein [Gemmatimonadales bacterium]|nr:carbonic anhydrase family protein [Gemmatimonadales bacterium]